MPGSVPLEAFSAEPVTRSSGRFRFFDGRFAPGTRLPSHYHERPSVFVILEGALEERFRSGAYQCVAGTALAKPADERHSDLVSHEGARALAVELDAGSSPAPELELAGAIVHVREPHVAALARQIAVEMRAGDAAAPLALEGLALELSAYRMRLSARLLEAHRPRWVDDVRDLLLSRLDEPLRVADLAAAVGRNPVHVARVFRNAHGFSLGAYLRRARVAWAAAELATSDAPLSAIALRAGFSDQSHFCRVFRRQMGVTPGEYRRRAGLGIRD